MSDRAVVAPVIDAVPASPRPWHIGLGERSIAVNLLATTPVDRLLERVERASLDTLSRVRHAVREITN